MSSYWDSYKGGGMDLWVEEKHRGYFATRFKCKKVLFSGKSKWQHIDVIETEGHGRMLLNDGIVMISDRDEFVYHEMISHVPLFVHSQPKHVLIIGGGDGGVAGEVLRHSVEKCVMVEIDEMVVQVCRKYFPKIAGSFQNPKLKLKIEDGVKFVKDSSEKFDVVLVDSTDPLGPAKALFKAPFYKDVYSLLKEDGILVAQAESPFFELDTQVAILEALKSVFPLVFLYHYSNTVYPGGFWSFAFASKKYHPLQDFKPQRVLHKKWDLSYYNRDIHKAAFAQPEFVKKTLQLET